MYPLLINLGPIPIHTYGFLIAIGFLSAVFTIRKLSEKAGLDVERILDLTFWILLVGFIGARVLFIFTRLDYFMSNPLDMFKVWEGGLVFFGGPIFCTPFFVWYTRKHKMPMWKVADAMIPGLVIAHMFGRFGCLSAGCCYGKPTGHEWGIRLYSDLVEKQLQGVPLHPTQLYEATGLLCIFLGLLYTFKHKRFDGQVFLTYFMTYTIVRSIVEIFRGDIVRGFVIDDWLSTSQFLSILIFIGASIALWYRLKQVRVAAGRNDARHA
jgi:phosphatidylglycerol:prolipoprotein diacylglycerol transferase